MGFEFMSFVMFRNLEMKEKRKINFKGALVQYTNII